jgi:F0F1-type ATP synthase assembly protein I
MENTKDSESNTKPQLNDPSTNWEEIEYKECSEDWRHRDRLIWATLAGVATIAGVIVGVAYGQSLDDKLGVRFWILFIGVILTLVLLISLIRHRMYQEGSEEQIQSLLNIKDWYSSPRIHRPRDFELRGITPSKKIDAALTSWAMRSGGFKWMVRGTLAVMLILAGLAIHTVVQWIFN